jgi:hypothetical protein
MVLTGGLARSARPAILAASIALVILFIALTAMQTAPYAPHAATLERAGATIYRPTAQPTSEGSVDVGLMTTL